MYSALGLAFLPPTEELIHYKNCLIKVMKKVGRRASISSLQREIQQMAETIHHKEALQELSMEYNRLFEGPTPPLVHPYESIYKNSQGLVMDESTIDVIQRYAQDGLSLSPTFKDLPDHVAVELEYLSFIYAKEAMAKKTGQVDLSLGFRRKANSFLREHLGRWVPIFCHKIISFTESPFYSSLAKITKDCIEWDGDSCSQFQGFKGDSIKGTDLPREAWQVKIEEDRCTLCGICAQICPQEALKIDNTQGEINISFHTSLCKGCPHCRQFCPEMAITLENIPFAHPIPLNGDWEIILRSEWALCGNCRKPYIPHVALHRILDRLTTQGEYLHDAAMLCLQCKRKRIF